MITYKIKELRENKRMSIRELAKISGVSKSQISDIENGRTHPTIPTLCLLADALECNPQFLFNYEKVSDISDTCDQ